MNNRTRSVGVGLARSRRVIRTPEEVFAATAAIPRTIAPWCGEEGPRWRITVSPGSVQIGTRDYAAWNARHERAVARRLREHVGMSANETISPVRGRITAWSRESRARMVRRLCTLDYQPLFEDDATIPALLTLTLPHDWETVAPDAATFKTIVNRFRSAYAKVWGRPLAGVWKMEFQYRQECAANGCHDPRAPHLHVLTVLPRGRSRSGLPFEEWVARAWVQACRHPDREERERQYRAHANGHAIDIEETLRYGDAKRIAVYFTKHGAFREKEYQNEMPASWNAAEAGGARFWGYWGLRPVEGVAETDPEIAVWVARHLRKLERSQPRTRPVEVWRSRPVPRDLSGLDLDELQARALAGDTRAARVWPDKTGRVRYWRRRRVRRRVQYLRGTRGFLSVNDGVAIAAGIARVVEHYSALLGDGLFSPPDAMRHPRPATF